MQVTASIFKAYDIRGVVPDALNPDFARALGHAFGARALGLGERQVAVGRAGRLSSPALAAALIGESGGTYQTIGRVRYSGWSGKATFHSIAIFHTGECRAASSHASGTPSLRA